MLKIIKQARRDRERIQQASWEIIDLLERYEGKMYFNPYDTLTESDRAQGHGSVQDKRHQHVTEIRAMVRAYFASRERDAILGG